MLNFHKIAAGSKGRLILRYFTEDTPEPIHPPALDEAGRTLEGPAVIPLRRPRCAGRLRLRVRAPARGDSENQRPSLETVAPGP